MIDTLAGFMAILTLVAPVQAAPILRPLPIAPDAQRATPPKKRQLQNLGVETTSASIFVADLATGKVLFSKKPHTVLPIASLTKLMTAMVWLETEPNLDETITFIDEDFDGESKPIFLVGETITKREALQSLLIGSVNASANAMARTSLGTERFVERMNAKAKEMKLASPHFVEPSGIKIENHSNAADVGALLSNALTYPEIKKTVAMSSVNVKGRTGKDYLLKSTNLLLGTYLNKSPYHIIGAKTGSLPQAGYSMAQVTSDNDGHQIVVVGLANDNHFARFQDVKAVTTWTFENYQW